MPYRYPPESVAGCWTCWVLGGQLRLCPRISEVSDQTIYNWRRQDLIDRGLEPSATSTEQTELRVARRRIREVGNRTGGDETSY